MSRAPPAPLQGTLADAYTMDFGNRTEDLSMWYALVAEAPAGPTCEIGVGDGRVSAHFQRADVLGIEIDRRLHYRARERGVQSFCGDASQPEGWAKVPPCALIFAAYSTMFLMDPEAQVRCLDLARGRAVPGGIVAVETFVPQLATSATRDSPVADPNDRTRPAWTRRTEYTVDVEFQRTRIHRMYGPVPGDWRLVVDEVVHWRHPDEVVTLFARAGMPGAVVVQGGNVPTGFVLTRWTAA